MNTDKLREISAISDVLEEIGNAYELRDRAACEKWAARIQAALAADDDEPEHDPGNCDDPFCEEPDCVADRKMVEGDRKYDERRDAEIEDRR